MTFMNGCKKKNTKNFERGKNKRTFLNIVINKLPLCVFLSKPMKQPYIHF